MAPCPPSLPVLFPQSVAPCSRMIPIAMGSMKYVCLEVGRSELPEVLRQAPRDKAGPLYSRTSLRPRVGQVSVIWNGQSARPISIFVHPDEREELFSWVFTYASDLAPLTS